MSGPTNKRGNNEQVVDLDDEPSNAAPSKYEDNLEPAVDTLKPTGRSTVIDPKKSGLSGDEVDIFIYSGREDGERDAVFVQLDIEGATRPTRSPATSGAASRWRSSGPPSTAQRWNSSSPIRAPTAE